jgi:hypothetical protein
MLGASSGGPPFSGRKAEMGREGHSLARHEQRQGVSKVNPSRSARRTVGSPRDDATE